MYKKIIFSGILVVILLGLFVTEDVRAAPEPTFDDEGNFVIYTSGKKATSGYRYRYLGFFVHETSSQTSPVNGEEQYNPGALYDSGQAGILWQEEQYCTVWEETFWGDTYVNSECRIPSHGKESVASVLQSAGLDLSYGDTVYFSSVFQVSNSSGVFYGL